MPRPSSLRYKPAKWLCQNTRRCYLSDMALSINMVLVETRLAFMELSNMIMDTKKFRVFLVALGIATFLFGCSKGSGLLGEAGESPVNKSLVSSDPALAMVERFNMGSNLESMAIQVAKSAHTYVLVAEKHGEKNAESVVAQEIKKLIPEYQPRWNRNLANAYSSHLSQDELRSLATDGRQSPYASKLLASRSSVGNDMKNGSMPILTELVTKALSNAIK